MATLLDILEFRFTFCTIIRMLISRRSWYKNQSWICLTMVSASRWCVSQPGMFWSSLRIRVYKSFDSWLLSTAGWLTGGNSLFENWWRWWSLIHSFIDSPLMAVYRTGGDRHGPTSFYGVLQIWRILSFYLPLDYTIEIRHKCILEQNGPMMANK